jgi:hypothetical protein
MSVSASAAWIAAIDGHNRKSRSQARSRINLNWCSNTEATYLSGAKQAECPSAATANIRNLSQRKHDVAQSSTHLGNQRATCARWDKKRVPSTAAQSTNSGIQTIKDKQAARHKPIAARASAPDINKGRHTSKRSCIKRFCAYRSNRLQCWQGGLAWHGHVRDLRVFLRLPTPLLLASLSNAQL